MASTSSPIGHNPTSNSTQIRPTNTQNTFNPPRLNHICLDSSYCHLHTHQCIMKSAPMLFGTRPPPRWRLFSRLSTAFVVQLGAPLGRCLKGALNSIQRAGTDSELCRNRFRVVEESTLSCAGIDFELCRNRFWVVQESIFRNQFTWQEISISDRCFMTSPSNHTLVYWVRQPDIGKTERL